VTAPGTPRLLGGRYQLGAPLGHGGMAEVFTGTDVRLGRDVAVKVLRADLARDPSFQARFRREAQAAASLNAPTIVSVYDTGEDASGVPYIVMERVDGRTLRDVLQHEGPLLPERALEIAADICTALATAHAAGIVHRDIKPANVMLNSAGQVKVMDFGIARAAADTTSGMTQTAAVIGTAAYLSPEQARGETVDARSDLYSTGCLLYELITGTQPFTGDSPVAVAYQHVREDPLPPSEYDESLSPAIDAVILKAMAKNPANRYQSALEMRADLLRARADEPVHATPVLLAPTTVDVVAHPDAVGSLRVADDHRGRRRAAYAVFALVLLAIVVAVALLVNGATEREPDLVRAPSLVGLTQEQAVARLALDGLQVGDVEEVFDPAPVGTVVRQSPPEGIVVTAGGEVDLVVSKGTELTIVPPEVVGMSRPEAEVLLAERDLVVGSDVARDGNFPAGTVLAVSPPPGSQLPVGSPVVLTVASGQVQVPDVRDLPREEAVAALQKAGFSVGIELRDDAGEPDRVLDQTPVNTLAGRGTTVVLVISQTPPPPPPPSPTPSPSPSPSPPPSPSPSPSPTPSPSPSP
jgi:beta-lactam-binding protein with PASTA domain/predicted Ser/Thr protein kinase